MYYSLLPPVIKGYEAALRLTVIAHSVPYDSPEQENELRWLVAAAYVFTLAYPNTRAWPECSYLENNS